MDGDDTTDDEDDGDDDGVHTRCHTDILNELVSSVRGTYGTGTEDDISVDDEFNDTVLLLLLLPSEDGNIGIRYSRAKGGSNNGKG